MKVLVINSGSSSLKYQLFDMKERQAIAKGLVERIGIPGSRLTHYPADREPYRVEREIKHHGMALEIIFDALTHAGHGVINNIKEIDAVGHRVVHGGEIFKGPVLVDDAAKEGIRRLAELAPLHNPANLLGIEACERLLPGIRQVAVFDTSFHHTIPPHAYMYGLPYRYYEEYGIRRYGFHGTSHKYVAQRAEALLSRPLQELKIISCHLGSGSSITAILGGCSIDTSMGFTPLEGLTMGTRSGDLDPAIITYLMEKDNLSPAQINKILNHMGGVLGVSGLSSDFRDLEKAAAEGNKRAKLAIDLFVHRVKKYIGAYAAELNGLDVLIFTAGLGENSPEIRAAICQGLDYLYLWVDPEKNMVRGREADISTSGSRVRVLVIPTNEELMIASETMQLIN
ncbi:acetate kinase [Thermincola ferriacetica]|uniref:Acetate kinase n=1 Tax=Thermincola ferriacetica TaxID=281456 RepID=A0A0L6VZL7_9FIRM|nr:acetate kinase [Thermincola ferriacetica]KNZ68772.1 acetate kinase [Thermincola ferriacetica]